MINLLLLLALLPQILAAPIETKVEALERAYRGYWREHAAIVDPATGRIAATFTGGPDRVGFPLYVCYQVDYPIITHNHPWGLLYTPSPEDVETAIRCDADQLRVASWNEIDGRAELCILQRNPALVYWPFVSAQEMRSDFLSNEGRGKYTYRQLIDAWTRFWRRFAGKYGYSFTCSDLSYRV